MIRIGIVGAGGIGNVHARQYRKRSDVELFVYDRHPDRCAAFTERFSATPIGSLEALIATADVIDVCTPTPSHLEIGLQAIAAGRAVLVEKPMVRALEEGVQLVQAAERAGVPFMPGQVVRFFPEYARGHRLVQEGAIGKPAAARARRGGAAPSGEQGWFMDHALSGGVLLDIAIHDFDWLRWTLGEVKHLYSRSVAAQKGGGPDYALTTLTFDSGCVGHVESTWMDPSGFRTTFEIAGSEGMIEHDSRNNQALRTTVAPESGAPRPIAENNLSPTDDPYYREIDGFLLAVANGTPPPVSGLDGLMAVSIALAALESARTGKVVAPAREF